MATKIIMPKQGLQMTEGTIISWFAQEGDHVEKGKPLFEIETDKLTIEIDSPATGILLKILHGEGDAVPVAESIGIIGNANEDISDLIKETLEAGVSHNEEKQETAAPKRTTERKAINTGEKIYASPRARWLAESKNIELSSVKGTGPEGLIIERDVQSVLYSVKQATPLARKDAQEQSIDLDFVRGSGPRGKVYRRDLQDGPEQSDQGNRLIKLTAMRKTIAERMRESLDTAAQAVHCVNVDMTEIVRMREMLKEAIKGISYTDIILKAVAMTLAEHRRLNSTLTNEGIIEYGSVHLGIAVATEKGLLVPVLRNADKLSLTELHEEAKRLSAETREGKVCLDELQGSTFTVSNLGMYQIDSFTAIINRPEAGILAVGTIKEAPVVVSGEILIRSMCQLSLTYDHRIIDGAPAAEFLQDLKNILENPYLLIS